VRVTEPKPTEPGGRENRGPFLDPAENRRALKQLLIRVPLGLLVEGGLYVAGLAAAVAIWFIVKGC
jgi:hypothetical protein